MIKQKINEIKKIAKDKKMNDKMLNQFLKELDDCYILNLYIFNILFIFLYIYCKLTIPN